MDGLSLDMIVLKIHNPPTILKENSISFDSIHTYPAMIHYSEAILSGFPKRFNQHYHYKTVAFADRGLRDSKDIYIIKHFFDIKCELNLGGLSGSPIFSTVAEGRYKLTGIFIAQYNDGRPLGFAVFSFYIKEVINKMEGIPYSKFKSSVEFKNTRINDSTYNGRF